MVKIWSELRFLDMVFDNIRFKLFIGYYFLIGFYCLEFGIILWCGIFYLQYILSLIIAVSGRLMVELVVSYLQMALLSSGVGRKDNFDVIMLLFVLDIDIKGLLFIYNINRGI